MDGCTHHDGQQQVAPGTTTTWTITVHPAQVDEQVSEHDMVIRADHFKPNDVPREVGSDTVFVRNWNVPK